MQGHVMESGTTNFGVNITTFQLHAAIYAARPDLKAIIDIQVYVTFFINIKFPNYYLFLFTEDLFWLYHLCAVVCCTSVKKVL